MNILKASGLSYPAFGLPQFLNIFRVLFGCYNSMNFIKVIIGKIRGCIKHFAQRITIIQGLWIDCYFFEIQIFARMKLLFKLGMEVVLVTMT